MNAEKDTGRAAGGFGSLYRHGFVRVAVAIPGVTVADPASNAEQIITLARRAAGEHAVLTVFPEMSLSSYTADDLFHQDALQDAVLDALRDLVAASTGLGTAVVVGAPLRADGLLFNCGVGFHVEICEDLWVPVPPSTWAALADATVLVNLSASNIVVGKAAYRRQLCQSQSARCIAAYLYAAAGSGESTTDRPRLARRTRAQRPRLNHLGYLPGPGPPAAQRAHPDSESRSAGTRADLAHSLPGPAPGFQ